MNFDSDELDNSTEVAIAQAENIASDNGLTKSPRSKQKGQPSGQGKNGPQKWLSSAKKAVSSVPSKQDQILQFGPV